MMYNDKKSDFMEKEKLGAVIITYYSYFSELNNFSTYNLFEKKKIFIKILLY